MTTRRIAGPPTVIEPDFLKDGAEPACRDADPEMFFPEQGDPDRRVPEAKRVCRRCDLQTACKTWALREHARHSNGIAGIWGGLTPHQRTHLLRKLGGWQAM